MARKRAENLGFERKAVPQGRPFAVKIKGRKKKMATFKA